MADALDASQPSSPQLSPQFTGQGGSLWSITMIVAVLCAAAALLFGLWFFVTSFSIRKEVTRLHDESEQLDKQITESNSLNGIVVEKRAKELVSTIGQFQKVIDGKKIWSKVMPAISGSTLKGVTLSGLSIDDKLVVKIDGSSVAITAGSDKLTPYGVIARQVVSFRDAKDVSLAPDPKKPVGSAVFSSVELTAISENIKHDEITKTDTVVGKFSMSVTINPALIAQVKTEAKK